MSEILTDAWRTLVPEHDDRHGPLPPIMAAMTVVTGLVDAFSYLALGHVFVANMTGNVVFCGFALGGSSGFSLPASITALASFAVGAASGGWIARSYRDHRGRLLYKALLLEFALVAVSFFIARFAPGPAGNAGVKYVLIVVLGLSMGVQNAAARNLAVPDLTTTVLTMTITGVGADNRMTGGPGAKLGRRTVSILAMFAGALCGAFLVLNAHASVALLCAGVLLAGAALAARRTLGSAQPWTQP